MQKDTLYERLLSDPPGDDLTLKEVEQEYQPAPRARVPLSLWIFVAFQTALIIFLGAFITTHNRPDCPINPVFPQVLYSPAQEALEYQPKAFKMGLGHHKPIYQQPPSKEVDQAWLDMYNAHGLSQIPKSQARLLPNKTLPIPADPDNYAVGLAVFHQLHCLVWSTSFVASPPH
ncbi:hypothetical protein NLI96_g4148 [Meripilus lineatus]|uniref:Uncharacterized protein n=1 Tax=Meripilus lineatus TaxID=2056292 RepID=A0AAD5V7M9_9APHY|nr:hypothetical protein NLI96_g4148 [Physisporinus lineatus]